MRGQVVVVTGAANGIGAAAARLVAGMGAIPVITDHDAGRLEEMRTELADTQSDVLAVPCDVSDQQQVEALGAEVLARHRRVDVLLHFAGIVESATLFDVDRTSFERIQNVNLWGALILSQVFAKPMTEAGSGQIVLTASNAARSGSTRSSPAYAASKGGVIALTRTMAKQLGPYGVRVNAVSPGFTMTGMSAMWSDEIVEQMVTQTPLGRLAEPEDIANAAVCLASDMMGFVTGVILEVNGGFRFD